MTIESILESEEIKTTSITVTDEAAQQRARGEQITIDFKMVTFSLSGKDYAVNIMHVKEIAKAGNFTYVPNALPFVVGVYNLRGEIIPILDMRLFFNITVPEHKDSDLENLLILTVGEQTFGIIVDKIDKVVGVQKRTIQPPHPLFGDINVKYISGVVETAKRLYILLDIERIFSKETIDTSVHTSEQDIPINNQAVMPSSNQLPSNSSELLEKEEVPTPVNNVAPVAPKISDKDYKFLVESLKNFKKFYVSPINEAWVKKYFEEWVDLKKGKTSQLQNQNDADTFLQQFWSSTNEKWWTKEYADAVLSALPENEAKQVTVWNPGCGKGMETYCLAAVLYKRYPDSTIKIYAQDIDLLNVSNASMMSVPEKEASGWLSPFIVKTVSGGLTFNQAIRDSILFEYHDCQHTNALPAIDIIFAKDILSLLDLEAQKNILSDFEEKLKGNGVLFIGDNEEVPTSSGFMEHMIGSITIYKKQ